jgi:hypothetical protein
MGLAHYAAGSAPGPGLPLLRLDADWRQACITAYRQLHLLAIVSFMLHRSQKEK